MSPARLFSRLLQLEEFLFAVDAPAVSGEGAVAADDAVAGDNDGRRVGCAGTSNCTNRGRLADFLSKLRVSAGFSSRDGTEGLPDAHLKGGSAEIEGKVERGGMFGELGDDLIEHGGEIGTRLEVGSGEHLVEA